MRKFYVLLFAVLFAFAAKSQISVTVTGNTNTTPNLSANYASLALALTDLNAVTAMSGPVTFTLAAGSSETAPPTGLTIGSASLNAVLSATNTVTIVKAAGGATVINAGVGTATPGSAAPDGILKLTGADYITIDGVTFTDGNAANPATMEFGIGFFKLNAGDGCNFNTIQNCIFNMQRINNATGTAPMLDGSVAIEVVNSTATAATTSLTPTNGGTLSTNGTNSNNKFYNNAINGGNIGIGLSGYAASSGVGPSPNPATFLGDLSNDIGGSTAGTGNTILNFGGAAAATNPAAGIRANNQWSINIQYNNVNSNNGAGVNHVTILRGIYGQAGTSANVTISNNTVSVKSGGTTSALSGIENSIGTTGASNTITISNNTVQNCTYATGTSGALSCITNTSSATTLNISNNIIQNNTYAAPATTATFNGIINSAANTTFNANNNQVINNSIGTAASANSCTFQGIYASGSPTNFNANNNQISGNSIANSYGSFYGIRGTTSTNNFDGNNIFNNGFPNNAGATSSILYGIYDGSAPSTETYTNNNIYNLTMTGTNTSTSNVIYGIYLFTSSGTKTISGNNVNNLSYTSSGAGSATVAGIRDSYATTGNIFKNVIHTLSSTGTTPLVAGLYLGSGTVTTINAYNNLIGNLSTPQSTGHNLVGIYSGSTGTNHNIYFNTVYLNTTSSGSGFSSSAVFMSSTTPTVTLNNNILINLSTATGAGLTSVLRRTTTALTTYGSTSNNNLFYAGTPSASNLIYYDGTNADQTLSAFKARVSPRESASVTETISTTPGVFFQSFTGPATGTSTTFLHIVNGISTQIESSGIPIAGITDDYDGNVRNATTPDMGADEGNYVFVDLTGPSITYTTLGNTLCIGDRSISATITDGSGVNVAPGTKPRIYFKKSTNANVLPATNDNTTDGWKYTEATNASSPFNLTITNSLIFGGVSGGDVIQYFVVAQDLASTPNVSINSGTFAAQPASVALTGAAFPITGTINNFSFVAGGLTGTVTIGAAGTYPTLSGPGGLFAAINSSGLLGNVTANILDAAITETGANALNSLTYGCGGPYTLTIKPNAGVTTVLSGSSATPLIDLNGADMITFDGSNSGGTSKNMTIRNTNTSAGTFRFINDATSNTIKNSIVEGAVTSTSNGVILFSTSTGSLGNSSNTIQNCDIRDRSDAAGVPGNAVYSSGTSTATNANNTITQSNIFNHTNAGVLVSSTGAGNGWVISQNNVYQTAARTAALTGLSIQGGSGHSVLSNFVGGTAANAGGSNLATSSTFRGIDLTVGTASATSVQGNVIKNIRSTLSGSFTASYGIFLQAGMANIGNISGNSVGSANVAERFEISGDSYGIRVSSTSTVNLSNNSVNNMTTAPGVPTGEYYFGISVEGTGGTHTVTNNTLQNFVNTSTPDASFNTQTIGMIVSATGAQTVSGNSIHDMGNTGGVGVSANLVNRVWGLILSGTGVGTVVEKNTIYNLYGSSSGTGALADVITGLQSQTVANGTYSNNMVAPGNNSSSDRPIFGILDLSASPAISNYYYNSVNITGTASGANSTYAFNRNSTATVTIKDNIFNNVRTGGTGFHVAMANTNAASTGWSATASNYNDLNNANSAHLTQWLGSAGANNGNLAAFQASTGGDANSINVAPVFISTTDLHLSNSLGTNWCLNGSGIVIPGITTDIDNQTRSTGVAPVGPDMGADEFTAISDAATSPTSQTVCSGVAITNITFTGTPTTYNWTRDNTGTVTGIAASGSGTISGTLTNTTTAPVVVTFTIIPVIGGCGGPPMTATVTVNPTPNAIATPSNQSICSGATITTVVITGGVSGTVFNWTRDNTGTVTGIAASGAGDISGALTNTTNAPVTVTFTITPTANGCPGTPITATVVVNPIPNAVAVPSSQSVCSGDAITTIGITGSVGGTTFNWTRDNTGTVTGIAASGSGDISGSLTNTTGSPVTVTFTITPTAAGCPGTPITATVIVNPKQIISASITQPTTCVSADGAIDITISNSPGPYTYFWSTAGGSGIVQGVQDQSGLTVGQYTVLVTDQTTGCQETAVYNLSGPGGCSICPVIGALATNPTPAVCALDNVTLNATGLVFMGVTYGISFKYSTVPLADPYTGGTVIGTVPNAGLGGGGTTATFNTFFAVPGNYYVYAVLSPTPIDPLCRPSQMVNLTVNSLPTVNSIPNATYCNGTNVPTGTFNFTSPSGSGTNNGKILIAYADSGGPPTLLQTALQVQPGIVQVDLFDAGTGTPSLATMQLYSTVVVFSNSGFNNAVTIGNNLADYIDGGGAVVGLGFAFYTTSPYSPQGRWVTGNYSPYNTSTNLVFATHTLGTYNAGHPLMAGVTALTSDFHNVVTPAAGATEVAQWDNAESLVAFKGRVVGITAYIGAVATWSGDFAKVIVNAGNWLNGVGTVTFNWTNNNTAIGLAASGTGSSLPTFTATNSGGAPIAGTISVTATHTVGATSCTGPATTFNITVNPTPTVNAVPNQVYCPGTVVPSIVFSGAVPGTVYTWSRTVPTPDIGALPTNGTGNVPSFTATNSSSGAPVSTFTVTPSYTNNGVTCTGTPITFTITIYPTPTINPVPNVTVCHNQLTPPIIFSSSMGGVGYNWTNNNTTIGLGASGSGNIPSFLANNPGTVPVVATITVTPVTSGAASQTFNYTGAVQTWTVPPGVTSITIQSWGAQGNNNGQGTVRGGLGGFASGTLAVTPGEVLNIYVGGGGTTNTVGGFNGGGAGGTTGTCTLAVGGGGGGASDVRQGGNALANRKIVAAGGGGSPGNRVAACARGAGGGGGGGYYGGGGGSGYPGATGIVPTGGTQAAGGTGGITGTTFGATNGAPGTLGNGGAGGNEIFSNQAGSLVVNFSGGAGGGTTGSNGQQSGLGDFTGQSGAGGSSYIGGVTSGITTANQRTGNGQVIISYNAGPPPVVCSGTPTTFTITVNPAPRITCPANITVNATPGLCGAIVNYPPAVGFGPPAPVITYNFPPGSFFPVGTTTVIATATNTCGTATCSFTVTVVDNIPPTIVCPANITVNSAPGVCGRNVTYQLPTISDNCPLTGGTPVTLNQSTNPTTITPIQIGCQYAGGITAENSWWRIYDMSAYSLPAGVAIKSVRFGIEKITVASVPITARIYRQTSGTFPGGTRTLLATQTQNFAVQTGTFQTITFTTPPSATPTDKIVVELYCPDQLATGAGFFIGSNADPETGDSYLSAVACGAPNPTNLADLGFPDDNIHLALNAEYYTTPPTLVQIAGLPSGAFFPVGTTTNTFRATDAAGNQSTCSFTVTVVDAQAPTITCPSNIVQLTDAGLCTATVTTPNPTFSDNCAVTQLTWVMTGATTGSSPATGINFVGTRVFNLSGTTGQGVTTITYTARDAAGNISTCSFTVTVNDRLIPVIGTQPATKFVCVGSNAVFTVGATAGGGSLTYQWQSWDGSNWVNIAGATTNTLTIPNVTFADNTKAYRVILTGQCSIVTSNTAVLYINPLPTVTLLPSIPPVLTPGQSLTINSTVNPPGGSYAWFFNGVLSPTHTTGAWAGITVDGIGTYRLVYTDPNGCTNASADLVVSGQASGNLWVYPNPNTGRFQVRFFNAPGEEVTINVYDSKGALVYKRKVTTGTPYTGIDVDLGVHIASGVYIVEAHNGSGESVGARRIIIRHP